MKNRTKNMLMGAAGVVLSAAAIRDGISKAIDRNMVGEALDREEPKTMQRMKTRLKGYHIDANTLDALNQAAEALRTTPHEVVELNSFDGTHLVGHLFRAEHPKRMVIAMHGWRSSWARDFCLVAPFLQQQGCTVLYAQQRGQGESDGEYMGFGMIERYDCREWIRWANENGFGDLPLYLAGISMGAATVLMTVGFPDLPDNLTGVLADCGFTSAKAEWEHISENNLHLPYGKRKKHVDGLVRKRLDLDSDGYSTLEAMETNKTPILFVHGTGDSFVPAEMTEANYEACKAYKKLLLVEGANHGMSYVTDPEAYEQAVLEFWEELEK